MHSRRIIDPHFQGLFENRLATLQELEASSGRALLWHSTRRKSPSSSQRHGCQPVALPRTLESSVAVSRQ
jgi:hypothetical protein